MRNLAAIILLPIFSLSLCRAEQVARYDFAGDLTAHFAPVSPPMGLGATFTQSSGAMLFHNASKTNLMEMIEHRHFKPRSDHDWWVSVAATVPLVYNSSPPPAVDDAWIEMVLLVRYVDASNNVHMLLNALGVYYNTSPGGPIGRHIAVQEFLQRAGSPALDSGSDYDLATTNETVDLRISYSSTNGTLSAKSGDTELLTISTQNWHLSTNGHFDLLLCGHSDNQPVVPVNPMRLDDFAFATALNPALGGTERVGNAIRFTTANLLPGNSYTVQTASNLISAGWSDNLTFPAYGTHATVTNSVAQGADKGFYRIRCD